MSAAVEVAAVARRFGSVQALAGIDLTVHEGEFFGLLGPNGAGKTTLISILAGLTRADAGTARDPRPRRRHRLPRRAPCARRRPAGAGVRSVLLGARDAAHPVRLLRLARERRLDRRDPASPRPHVEGRRQHALAVGRHEAARARRPGAGAQAAGDRAGRADRRRRRRAAAEPVGVHPQAQSRRPHDHPDHALPRGSGGAVRAHRDDEGGAHRRARHEAEPAVAIPGTDRAARRRARARRVAGARAARGFRHPLPRPRPLRRARRAAGGAARGRTSRSTSWRSPRPTSSRCSCASWPARTHPPCRRRHSRCRRHERRRRRRLRMADAPLQGAPALLEGRASRRSPRRS